MTVEQSTNDRRRTDDATRRPGFASARSGAEDRRGNRRAGAGRAGRPGKHGMRALLRSLRFMLRYRWSAAVSLVCVLAGAAGNLAVPWLTQRIVDSGILAERIQAIIAGSLIIVAVSALRALFTFLEGVLAARMSQGVAFDLRNALYDHIQSLSFSYHDRSQTGQLLTRATSDVDMVRTFISTGVVQVITTVVLLIGSMVLLFTTNWRLALVVVPIMLVVFVIFSLMSKIGRPMFMMIQEKLAALNTRLEENVVGIRMVKAFTGARREQEQFDRANRELHDQTLRVGRIFTLSIPLVFAMANFGTLAVTWGGGFQILAQRLTIGELVAFQGYLIVAMFPIMMLGMIMMTISQASASAERIFEILDAKSDVQERESAATLAPLRRGLAFEGVGFRYFRTGAPVLQDVSFATGAAETLAIIGATGSGKSTIINLIPRFYDVTAGRITIDGVDIRAVTLASLRRQIGIVLEETTLFGGTIRENIAYGRPDATDEEVEQAARAAAAHDFVSAFADGYHSVVGERGVTLSGGQKQRLAIARALLIEPRILILDDSTSNVDYETEIKIRNAIEKLKRDRLAFVIASRMSTVMAADRVLLLHEGRFAGLGDHHRLLHDNPLYAEIYYAQLVAAGDADGGPNDAGGDGHRAAARAAADDAAATQASVRAAETEEAGS